MRHAELTTVSATLAATAIGFALGGPPLGNHGGALPNVERYAGQIEAVEALNTLAKHLAEDRAYPQLHAVLDVIDGVIATTTTGIHDDEGNLRDSCIWVPLTAEDCTSDCSGGERYWTTLQNYQDARDIYYMCSQFSFHPLCGAGEVPVFVSQCHTDGLTRCSSAWQMAVSWCDTPPPGATSHGCYLELTCADVICEPECWGGVPLAPGHAAPHVRKR